MGQTWAQCKDRCGDGGLALVLILARQFSGLTLAELGRRLEIKPTVKLFKVRSSAIRSG